MNNLRAMVVLLLVVFSLSTALGAISSAGYEIEGLQGAALQNAQNRLISLRKETEGTQGNKQFEAEAPAAIQEAIKPFGYFNSHVTLHNHTFIVHPGAALRISHVRIAIMGDGKNNSKLQEVLQQFPLKAGDVLKTPQYEEAKKKLFNTTIQEGYLTPQFKIQTIVINLSKYTSEINLLLDTGPRSYFGTVIFNHTPLSNDLLSRYVTFKLGKPFSSKKLLQFQNDLIASNYFEKVDVKSNTQNASQGHVPITVKLAMKKMSQYLSGVGFGTDTGPRATFGANFFYINQYGHAIASQAMVSSVQSSVGVSYKIPGENPAADQYAINENFSTSHLNQGSSQTQQFGLSYVKKLRHHWQRTYFVNYAIEQFKFDDLPGQSSYLIIPGINFTRITTAQTRIFTNSGNSFSLNLEGALRQLVSDNNFFQAEIQEKYIMHMTENDRVIFRADLGYTYTDSLQTFPLSLRFYTGGAESVRGFSYQALGPGKYLVVGSTEYQRRIKGNWYGTTFYDIGNAMDNTTQPFSRGVGVGVMWASPMGPIELSLAKAISLPGKPMRIQFSMGPDL